MFIAYQFHYLSPTMFIDETQHQHKQKKPASLSRTSNIVC